MKRKIADTASELFRSEGYGSVSMRRLAREIGVTPMALYKYFPSKMAILSCLWTELFEDVVREMTLASAGEGTPLAKLTAISQAYVDYWLQNRDNYFLVFMSSGLGRGDVRDFVSESNTAAKFEPFYEMISAATRTGRGAPSVKVKGDQLLCGLHGVMHCIITIPGYEWSPVDQLVEGFARSACE